MTARNPLELPESVVEFKLGRMKVMLAYYCFDKVRRN